ncbi:MAG: tetratricopeptide repeat protein [Ignavibacteria bacterium]|nr:tetratricopeptide repeat protein [Ignavibacteria bacterium]
MKKFIILLFFIFISVNIFAQELTPVECLARADTAMRYGRFVDAIKLLDKYVEMSDKNPDVFFKRGLSYYSLFKFPEATKDFNAAIALDSTYAMAYNMLGLINMRNNLNTQAINNFSKAIKSKVFFPEAYNNRGYAYYLSGDNENAMDDFNKALEQNPNYAEAFLYRGIVRYANGDFDISVQDFTKALNNNKNLVEAYFYRGMAYKFLEKWVNAKQDLEYVVKSGSKYNKDAKIFLDEVNKKINEQKNK